MTEVTLSEWNHFLTKFPNAHLLQMGEWGELKNNFGWEPVRVISVDVGAQILFRKLPLGFTIAYMPKVPSDQFWQEVDSICKKNRAVFLKIEPDMWEDATTISQLPITNYQLRTSPHNIQPPRTIIVDINASEEDILARMKPKCRYNIRLAEKKGVTVRTWDDVSAFHEMMIVTGGRDGFGVHSKEYYQRAYELFHPKGTCELLLAEYEGKPLTSLMVLQMASVHGTFTAHPTTKNATECPRIFCSGKPSAGQRRAAAKNTTCGASPTRTKRRSKPNSSHGMTVCGASTVSSAASVVKSNVRRRHWIEFIILFYIGFTQNI